MERIRERYLKNIALDFEIVPIYALLGPRQCGKTTLAHQFAKTYQGPVHYFDLEDYTDLSRLTNPKFALDHLEGLIIIDEVQRKPELFQYLHVLADRPNTKTKFLILGSASRDLNQQNLWNCGGFPKSFLAETDISSVRWRQIYMQTYFEKDLAYLGLNLPPQRILKLWAMLAHYQACTINYAHMAQFMEISVPTIKKYLNLLEGTFMIRELSPWYENLGKRLVKTPKLYIRDSGIYHQLLNIQTYEQLILNTHVGFSWEAFALEEITKSLNLRNEECYFWATHQEAELDLFVILNGKRMGFEFKISDQPSITKSMRIAMDALKLEHLYIVTPNEKSFPLENKVSVLALKETGTVK